MEKDHILVLAQLFASMKDAINKLEEAVKSEDIEHVNSSKKEILAIQQKIDGML